MKKLKVNFTTIPNDAILDTRLDTYEFRVLCYLCKLSNEENICFPSYSTIAANMNISRSKTTNIINRLIDLGYIEKENLRDNMSDLELVLTMLAEATTTELSKTTNPQNFQENVEVAKIWNGMSYYIVNIEHLGVKEMDGKTYLPAYYGTVRNHAYQIKFGAVKGLGTPVFDPEAIIPEPVQPDDTESFIEAQINVLSWHLIKQDVTLQ